MDFETALYQALGEVSMCWSETPKGIFDSTKAKEIGDKVMEQYRLQMAGISTASFGYCKKNDIVHEDYITPALNDVISLYEKYDKLYQQQNTKQEIIKN